MRYCSEFCANFLLEKFNFDGKLKTYFDGYFTSKDPNYIKNVLEKEGWNRITETPQMGDIIMISPDWMFMCINDHEVMTYIHNVKKIFTKPISRFVKKYEIFRHPEIDAKVKALKNT